MSDDLIIASTTDTAEQLQAALDYGNEPAETPETPAAPAAEAAPAEPVVEEPPAETPPAEEPPAETPPAPKAAADAKVKPVRADFGSDEDYDRALLGHKARKRIDRLTFEKNEAGRRADAAEAELARVRAGARPEPQAPPPPPPPPFDMKAAVEKAPTVLALKNSLDALGAPPKLADFESTEEWETALTDYTTKRTDIVANMAAERKDVANRIENNQAAQAEQSRRSYEEFQDTRVQVTEDLPDFDEVMEANADMELSSAVSYRIATNGIAGHALAYYLAQHRDVAARLYKMGDTGDALIEIGKIEAKMSAELPMELERRTPTRSAAPAPRNGRIVSSAAAPITPVRGGGATNASTVPLEKTDYRTFAETRNRQEAARRRHR